MSEQRPPQERFFVGSHELIDEPERPDEPAFNAVVELSKGEVGG